MSDRSRNRAAIVLTVVVLAAGSGTAYAGLWPVKAREHLRRQLEDQASRNDRLEDVNAALRRRNHRLLRRLGWRERQVRRLHRVLRQKPSVVEAINLAAAVYDVSSATLWRKARCESGLWPYAHNPSGASGLFQFLPSTFRSTPFGRFSIWSPYANALAAGWMHAHGRGGEWSCR